MPEECHLHTGPCAFSTHPAHNHSAECTMSIGVSATDDLEDAHLHGSGALGLKLTRTHMQLLESPETRALFPEDVIKRSQELRGYVTTGAYTVSSGSLGLRKIIAEGIERRDGHPCDPENLMLCGAHPLNRLMLASCCPVSHQNAYLALQC